MIEIHGYYFISHSFSWNIAFPDFWSDEGWKLKNCFGKNSLWSCCVTLRYITLRWFVQKYRVTFISHLFPWNSVFLICDLIKFEKKHIMCLSSVEIWYHPWICWRMCNVLIMLPCICFDLTSKWCGKIKRKEMCMWFFYHLIHHDIGNFRNVKR